MVEGLKPALQRFFEGVAAIMELDVGQQRLELVFEDGRLRQWWAHAEKLPPGELGRFDERAQWLVGRRRSVEEEGASS